MLVVDGGIVSIPSLRLTGGDIGLPDGRSYACFAETAILALSGHSGHFSLGNPTLDQVDAIRERARALGHLGFRAADPTSFGRPVALESAFGGDRMTRVVLLGGRLRDPARVRDAGPPAPGATSPAASSRSW